VVTVGRPGKQLLPLLVVGAIAWTLCSCGARSTGPDSATREAVRAASSGAWPPWISAVCVGVGGQYVALVTRRATASPAGPVRELGGDYTLWVVDLNSHAVHRLSRDLAPMTGVSERPAGRELVFADRSWAIRVINPTNGETKTLAYDPQGATFMWPRWAPDGSRVAFQANLYRDDNSLKALFSADPEPGQKPRLQATDLSAPLAWDWDPRSRTLVYVPARQGEHGGLPKSSIARRFSPPWHERTEAMAWSPDGAFLACALADQLSPGHLVVILERSLQRPLFRAAFPVMSPSLVWSPRGQALLFGPKEDGAVCAYDVRHRKLEFLASSELRGATPVASVEAAGGNEWLFYLSAERRSLLVSDGLGGNIHELLRVAADGTPSVLPIS